MLPTKTVQQFHRQTNRSHSNIFHFKSWSVFTLQCILLQVSSLHLFLLLSARSSQSGGLSPMMEYGNGGFAMSPQDGVIFSFSQSHRFDALHAERSGVAVAFTTPHVLSPSILTRTISVSPVSPKVPIGTWPCCGSNCTESYPFSRAHNPKMSLSSCGHSVEIEKCPDN